LGLDAEGDLEASSEDVRVAYRLAVRAEHPDTSSYPDAEARFHRVRKAYALLSDEGTRALLLEALEREVETFEELAPDTPSSSPWIRWVLIFGLLLGVGGAWLRLGSTGEVRMSARRKRMAEEVEVPAVERHQSHAKDSLPVDLPRRVS